jgi:hypothetical protein
LHGDLTEVGQSLFKLLQGLFHHRLSKGLHQLSQSLTHAFPIPPGQRLIEG